VEHPPTVELEQMVFAHRLGRGDAIVREASLELMWRGARFGRLDRTKALSG
jgi:hypothetical protein